MRDMRSAMINPQTSTSRSSEPLLDGGSDDDLGSGSTQNRNNIVQEEEEGRGRSWPTAGAHERRRHELRSRSPGEVARYQNKRKITLAALALGISLVTFVVGFI